MAWQRCRASRPNAQAAQAGGLTVVTRNVRDFGLAGVPLIDPFDTGA